MNSQEKRKRTGKQIAVDHAESWQGTADALSPHIKDVDHLKRWIVSDSLVRPYFWVFYQKTDKLALMKKVNRGPLSQEIEDQVKNFELAGSRLYTKPHSEDSPEASKWTLTDWYCWFACNVEKENSASRIGIFSMYIFINIPYQPPVNLI
jgi:hypothetical protein